MGKAYYDHETDTLYVAHGDGSGWFVFLVVLATPFFVIASLLKEYAQIVNRYPVVSTGVYFLLAWTTSWWFHRKKKIANRKTGIVAGVLTLLPVWMVQLMYAVPYVAAGDKMLPVTIEWVLVTGISFGVSYLLLQIGLLFRNGKKHFLLAGVYLLLALAVWIMAG